MLVSALLAGCGAPATSHPGPFADTAATSLPLLVGVPGGEQLSWSLNPLNPSFLPELDAYALLPLAFPLPPRFGRYLPELAVSWHVAGGVITIQLRAGARWQDGQPVRSQDVVTALELEGTYGNNLWSGIAAVRAPNSRTVVIEVRKGQSASLTLDRVLAVAPLPSGDYATFLQHGLQQDLVGYWGPRGGISPARRATDKRVLADVFHAAETYQPKKLNGDGPFVFAHAVTNGVLLTKWRGFWDAAAIHVPAVQFEGITVTGVTAQPLPKRVDLVSAQLPSLLSKRWLSTADSHEGGSNSFNLSVLSFNEKVYPFNLVAVRRAIALIVNRQTIMALAYGGHTADRAVRYPVGIPPAVLNQWLTPAQRRSLDPYSFDPAAAVRLLLQAGFHRQNGLWFLPDGRRFTVTVNAPLGLVYQGSNSGAVGAALEGMLKRFGIHAVGAVGYAELNWGWSGDDGLDPLVAVANLLGPGLTFTSSDETPPPGSLPQVGFVPGLGRVGVPATISAQAAAVEPGPAMSRLTWDWARYVDQQLPYLTLAEGYQQVAYSTARYVDWPGAASPLWQVMGITANDGVVAALESGYIRPGHRT